MARQGLMNFRGRQWGPRLGFAYNIGQTVIRVGGTVFYDRITTFEVSITSNYVTNPPVLVEGQIFYGNLANIPTAASVDETAAVTAM